jgi:hypothetical protein
MQFANSLGFRTVAITRHRQGGALLKLGAHYFIDSATDDGRRHSTIPAVCNPGDWQVWEVRSRLPSTSEGGRNPFSACSRLSVSASALPMLPAPLWTSGPRKSGQEPVARD